jgi:hypothetical protein
MKVRKSNLNVQLTVLDHIFDAYPFSREAFARLIVAAPAPRDYAQLGYACAGATRAIEAACKTLMKPNEQARDLREAAQRLNESVQQTLADLLLCDPSRLRRRGFSGFSAWRALVNIGQEANRPESAGLLILGITLMLSMAKSKQMSYPFCERILHDESLRTLSTTQLMQLRSKGDAVTEPNWLRQHRGHLSEFLALFEVDAPTEQLEKGLQVRALDSLVHSSYYPTRGQRQAVLTRHCLSQAQFANVKNGGISRSLAETLDHQFALWLTAISNVPLELLREIPIGPSDSHPIVYLDLEAGFLRRDVTELTKMSSDSHRRVGTPGNFLCDAPLPINIHNHLKARANLMPLAQVLCDLVPSLASIGPDTPLYVSLSRFNPTFAKYRNTAGILLRQEGIDTLLVSVITANFGHGARSKLYYAQIDDQEMRNALSHAYRCLGFDSPVQLSSREGYFGTALAASIEAVKEADQFNQQRIRALQPARNCSDVEVLREYHNAYTKGVALRDVAALALRTTSKLALPVGSVWPVGDKVVGGHIGAFAVVCPPFIQEQSRAYNAHCHAMAPRFRPLKESSFRDWLKKRSSNELRICSPKLKALQVRSIDVVKQVRSVSTLTPDFGRKLLENELRKRGVRTCDIDRMLRHEVQGQEMLSSTSEHSQFAWRQRIEPVLQSILTDIFPSPLFGLSKGRI